MKRKNRRLWHIASFLTLLLAPSVASADAIIYTLDYDINKLHIVQDTVNQFIYSRVSYDGYDFCGEVSAPMLPCKYVRFAVPYNATNISVSAMRIGTYSTINIPSQVYPVQQSYSGNDSIFGFTLPDYGYYFSPMGYPDNQAWLVDDGFYHGVNRLITVGICPISYYGMFSRIELGKIRITINYLLNNNQGGNQAPGVQTDPIVSIARVNSNLASSETNRVKELVANPNQVESFARTIGPEMYPYPDIDNAPGGYEYCVITNRQLAPSFKKLVALKRQKGYSAGTICVEDLYTNPYFQSDLVSNMTDSAGSVRQYLRFAHRFHSTQYVLMGGKESVNVPVRYIQTNTDYGNFNTPSDMYFCDLDMNWSLPINSNEWGRFNFAPELYVGRLLCESSEHIDNYTDKLLWYELNPGNGNYSYLRRTLYTQTDFSQSFQISQKNHAVSPFNDNDTTFIKEIGKYPNGNDIITKINETGFGFMSMHGHGSPIVIQINSRCFSIYPTADFISISNDSCASFDSLNNKRYPNILSSLACSTMPFDKYLYSNIIFNVGESFTLGKEYGGIAYLGNTRIGILNSDTLSCSNGLEYLFLKSMSMGINKLGIAESESKWMQSKHSYNDIHCRLTHNLLGDPEVEMWTDIPSLITDYAVTRNNNGIQIQGTLPDSCIVAYCDNTGNHGRHLYRSSDGAVNLTNVSSNSCIMLYKHNYIPSIAPLKIQNTTLQNSQYVFASDFSIGRDVDANRTEGNVVIASGAEYEVEATGDVLIGDGTIISEGATLRIWTPGTVTISGGTVLAGGKVEIFARDMAANGAFDCELGSSVKFEKYTPLR